MRQSIPLWLLWGVLLLRAMPLAAHEAQTYFETGVRAFTEGKYDEAVTALTQAITSYPHYAQAHYMLGNTYYQQQNYAAGAASLRARRGELPRVCRGPLHARRNAVPAKGVWRG